MRSLTKVKASKLKFKMGQTGSGPIKVSEKLTDVEQKIMNLIGPTCAEGIVDRRRGDLTFRQIHVSTFQ